MIYRIFTPKVSRAILSLIAAAVILTVFLPDVSAAEQMSTVLFAIVSVPLIIGVLVFMVYGLRH